MFKSIIAALLLIFTISPAWACPFDEAGIEVTILAHNAITEATESGDFEKARKEIIRQKYLYEYFESVEKKPLYQPLLDASNSKNAGKVKQLLDHSLVLEINELLGQVEGMFGKYQKSRLRLIKAKKHLKVLTSEKEPMIAMKKVLKSIGNPGLMGMGKRDPDKKVFMAEKEHLLSMIGKISITTG